MQNSAKKALSLVVLAVGLSIYSGCSSSSSSTPSSSTASATEASELGAANTAINTAGTDNNGVLSGTGTVSASSANSKTLPANFSTSAICTHSGDVNTSMFANNDTAGWALAHIYCNFSMRPDGPDTVRGGLDRTYGLLCGLGALTFDGAAHTTTLTINSTCFSPAFITIACSGGASSCSYSAQVTAYTAAQYAAAGKTAPAAFNKIVALQVSPPSGSPLVNTVAIYDSSTTERAVAINYDLPGGTSNSVLAIYMNSTTGVVRYEGRFAGSTSYDFRHIRAQINGTVAPSTFALSAITEMQFIEGNNFGTETNSAFYLSLTGTAGTGRALTYKSSTLSGTWAAWGPNGNPDDGSCYPSGGCTSVVPLTLGSSTPANMTFLTSATSADAWFAANSLLNSTSTTVPVTDLWP